MRLIIVTILAMMLIGCVRISNKQENGQEYETKVLFSYKAVLQNNEIYLKPLFNNTDAFGPFRIDKYGTTYVHYPNPEDQEFMHAMQIYFEPTNKTWVYYDNNIMMKGEYVDPNGVLR